MLGRSSDFRRPAVEPSHFSTARILRKKTLRRKSKRAAKQWSSRQRSGYSAVNRARLTRASLFSRHGRAPQRRESTGQRQPGLSVRRCIFASRSPDTRSGPDCSGQFAGPSYRHGGRVLPFVAVATKAAVKSTRRERSREPFFVDSSQSRRYGNRGTAMRLCPPMRRDQRSPLPLLRLGRTRGTCP